MDIQRNQYLSHSLAVGCECNSRNDDVPIYRVKCCTIETAIDEWNTYMQLTLMSSTDQNLHYSKICTHILILFNETPLKLLASVLIAINNCMIVSSQL